MSTTISPTGSQHDKFIAGATASVLQKSGVPYYNQEDLNHYGASCRGKRFIDLARTELQSLGKTVTGNDREDAKEYLRLDQSTLFAMDGTVNSRGDHPGLTSNIVNTSLNAGYDVAVTTYEQWAARHDDVPDLEPHSIIDVGVFNQLDLIQEHEKTKELKLSSEQMTWLKAERYGNKVGMTVEMMLAPSIGGFIRQLSSLTTAGQHTINHAMLSLVNENPKMFRRTSVLPC